MLDIDGVSVKTYAVCLRDDDAASIALDGLIRVRLFSKIPGGGGRDSMPTKSCPDFGRI